ncbi:MAG: hypothetical protein ACHQFW_07105 [Chitinophagales bacterium]
MKILLITIALLCNYVIYAQTESITFTAGTGGGIFNYIPLTYSTPSPPFVASLPLGFVTQSQNTFFAGQVSGTGTPTFRALNIADAPFWVNTTDIQNSIGGAKTFTSDLTVSGTNTNLFLANGVDDDNPSLSFTLSTTTGLYLTTGSDTRINVTVAGNKRAHFTADGSFSVANNPAFTNQLDINISHDSYEGVEPEDAQDGGLGVTTYGGDPEIKLFTSTFTGRTSSGTFDEPAQTEEDQAMAEFSGKGWCEDCEGGMDGFEPSNRGVFGVYAANDQMSTSQGAYCAIQTTKTGNYPVGQPISDHFSFVIDPNGNGGLTWLETGGFGTSLPSGWTADDDAKFFSIESSEPSKDFGLLIQNGDATNAVHGTKGINIWYDNSANTTYIDNIRSDGTPYMITRLQTLGTSTTAIVTSLTGTNFGGDVTPDNVLTVGPFSEFQISSAGKVVKYNGVPTIDNGVPSEIYALDQNGLSASVIPTDLISSLPADGMYRVTWVATVTTIATTSSTLGDFQIKYTDPVTGTSQTKITNTVNNITRNADNSTQTAVISGSNVIFAKGTTALKYVMGYTSNPAPPTAGHMVYNLHVKVEAL